MNRTLLDQCFRVEGRKTWYDDTAQLQADVDRFLEYYNLRRTHQGYRLNGRTPVQALAEALALTFESVAAPLTNPPENQEVPEAINAAA